jgi:hypothetical protein
MKVPAITIYQAIQYHIDKLCAFYGFTKDLIIMTLSSDAAHALALIPEYTVHGLSRSVLEKGLSSGCREHFGVGEVQIALTADEMFYLIPKHTTGFELFRTIAFDKRVFAAGISGNKAYTEIIVSRKAVDILNTMEERETVEYPLSPETPFTNGFGYLQQYCDTVFRQDGKKWKLSVVEEIPEETGRNQTNLLYAIVW